MAKLQGGDLPLVAALPPPNKMIQPEAQVAGRATRAMRLPKKSADLRSSRCREGDARLCALPLLFPFLICKPLSAPLATCLCVTADCRECFAAGFTYQGVHGDGLALGWLALMPFKSVDLRNIAARRILERVGDFLAISRLRPIVVVGVRCFRC